MNSPILPPGSGPVFNGPLSELPSRAFPSLASAQFDGPAGPSRAKRNKRDSRKKREAKGQDQDSAPAPKKRATGAALVGAALASYELTLEQPPVLANPRDSDQCHPQPRQLHLVTQKTSTVLGQSWEFYDVADKITNKNGFRYSYAIADPGFPNIKYRQSDAPPHHARFSYEDSPPGISFSQDARAVTTPNVWNSSRANVFAREGTYYYEARVISGIVKGDPTYPSPRGHVRIGFGRRESDLDVNVGVDCYGYAIRDVNGEAVNRMRCEPFFPKGEAIYEGDVIGMLITLPPLSLHKKIVEGNYDPAVDGDGSDPSAYPPATVNIIRDRTPWQWKGDFCWQQSDIFPTKYLRDYAWNLKETPTYGHPDPLNNEDASLRTLPGSSITVFKNGVKMGTPFEKLYAFLPPASRRANGTNNAGIGRRENADDGMIGYYPAVSCYGGGAVECRFEGPWWVGPPERTEAGELVRPFGERFEDQIAEDVVADLVDEVEAEYSWGGIHGGEVGRSEVVKGGAGVEEDEDVEMK